MNQKTASQRRGTLHLPQNEMPAEVPIEKPEVLKEVVEHSPNAIIRVLVKLPIGDIKLEFLKRNVMANASLSQLESKNFSREIQQALEKILGRVEVV